MASSRDSMDKEVSTVVIRINRITNNQVLVAFLLSNMVSNLLNTKPHQDKVVRLVVEEVAMPASFSPSCSSVSRM
jgi:hypothetical protein